MVTKWKGWTAKRPVKIVSFILFLALCVAIVAGVVSANVYVNDTHVSFDVVFSNIEDGEYFISMYLQRAYHNTATLAFYGSEASIRAGEHLEWFEYNDVARLERRGNGQSYAWIEPEYDTEELRARYWNEAIQQQMDDFRAALRSLAEAPGLLYRIDFESGTEDISNNDTADFRSMPVYLYHEQNTIADFSHAAPYYYYPTYSYFSDHISNVSISLAFTQEAYDAQNAIYAAAKAEYIRDFVLIGISCVLLIVLLAIQILGAGRKISDGGACVHFTVIDRVPLDLGAALTAGWIVLIAVMAFDFGYQIIRIGSYTATTLLFGGATVLFVTPVLLWLLSLAKRLKAGKFWRHTLVYMIPHSISRWLRSLWCGIPLMLKVGIIGLAAFLALIFANIIGTSHEPALFFFSSLAITIGVVYLLLRYAKRLHALERGAAEVSSGHYVGVIYAGDGELGSIADSIMGISDGINSAVEQRMKSERLKTELITNVSHDIRTPLTSIITYTDLLEREGLTGERAAEYLDIIVQKSQRLKTLTDELFEAAKAATGNIEVQITELDLTSLISQVLGELDSAIKSSTLDLRVNLPDQAPVRADGKLMWRVMENLMSNVLRYALPGSRVYLSMDRTDDDVRLELKNISATELNVDPSELTERFKRGDESRAGEGSGLGLSIVQSFVEAQRGRFVLSIDGDLFKATLYLPGGGGGVNT